MSSTLQRRLRFDRAEVEQSPGGGCTVTVTLSFGQRVIEGSATDDGSSGGTPRVAAAAALKAVEKAVANRFSCALADVDRVTALGKDLIAVLVDVTFEGRDVQVFGSCQISGSEVDAAVKSSLNATNRFFELSMRE